MFSERVPADRQPNPLTRALRRARDAGRPVIDLTVTNPTAVGLEYPPTLLEPLANRAALQYTPHPFGLEKARAAVAADYARRGLDVTPDRIVLTASTSEAYSLLFKLLCAPTGDQVLTPVPSYPLFEYLTRLDGVETISYPLEYHGHWSVDFESLDCWWTSAVRAVLAVSPNNPTGSVLTTHETDELAARCAARDAAMILDEVFADYPIGSTLPTTVRGLDCLTFRLGGLSKSAGLPQVKLGWIAVDGPGRLASEAIDRLEVICDTYLSVSTPAQIAAPALIDGGAAVRQQIIDRVRGNYEELRRLAASRPAIEVLDAEAGWSAVVRVPSTRSEDDLVLDLVERDGVLVHPGFFFDFPHEAFVVVSLLPEPSTFHQGIQLLMERADG
jgi:aspartate/methionine/tyrosine aminotransferase